VANTLDYPGGRAALTYYPIFLDLTQRRCLVVGGGTVAERKVQGLLEARAAVTVVSPILTTALTRWAVEGVLTCLPRTFQDDDVEGHTLVIAATDRVETNLQVAAAARRRNLWVNVVDTPQACDFIAPAVVRRGSLQIAISTGGKSPLLAKRLRQGLEALIGEEYAELTDVLGAMRTAMRYRGEPSEVWHALLQHRIEASGLPFVADIATAAPLMTPP
jgi:precorrin-2 dehydrogenase/sirohydrochlorin ferrochelatase